MPITSKMTFIAAIQVPRPDKQRLNVHLATDADRVNTLIQQNTMKCLLLLVQCELAFIDVSRTVCCSINVLRFMFGLKAP